MTFVVTGAACLVHSYPLAVRLTISSHETQRPYGSAEVCCLLEAEADYSIDWKLVFDISGASNFVAQVFQQFLPFVVKLSHNCDFNFWI